MKEKRWKQVLCILLATVCLSGCGTQAGIATQPSDETETQLPQGTTESTTSYEETEESPFRPLYTDPTEITEPTDPTEPPTTVPEETVFQATDMASLLELVNSGRLENGDLIRLTGDMEITEMVIFSVPVNLCVEAQITCTCPLVVETSEAGSIYILVDDGIDTTTLDITLDAPNCDVYWENHPYETDEAAAVMTNVATFNGRDLRSQYGLGGAGMLKLTDFAMQTQDNASLSAPLRWQILGNVVYLEVSYLTSDTVLENAMVQMTRSDGTVVTEQLDMTQGQQWYTLWDGADQPRTYKIVTRRITYNLPVFYIEIENGKEVTSREEYLNATVRIDTENAVGNFPGLETTNILIRGRGHYSWTFDKKPYKIRFEEKTSVLGMNASKNWTLIANYTDRSLIQNYVALEMGKVMDYIPYHSTQYPVDVFVNGSYRGVYTFGEQLEAKEERINLEENYEDPNTDYLLEVGGSDPEDVLGQDYFHAGTLSFVAIKHPDTDNIQQSQLDYLIDYVRKADAAVCSLSNYEDYIDVDSLIDWVIMHELTYNLDCCFRRSCYLIKEKDGKLKMGPIWDFDLAFGSYYRYEAGDWATIGEADGYVGITWMNYLKDDPAFMARFTARWNEIKGELKQTALDCVDRMGALVTPSAEMNFRVWNILEVWVPAQPSDHYQYNTYAKRLARLRQFIIDRYQWLDDQLNG